MAKTPFFGPQRIRRKVGKFNQNDPSPARDLADRRALTTGLAAPLKRTPAEAKVCQASDTCPVVLLPRFGTCAKAGRRVHEAN